MSVVGAKNTYLILRVNNKWDYKNVAYSDMLYLPKSDIADEFYTLEQAAPSKLNIIAQLNIAFMVKVAGGNVEAREALLFCMFAEIDMVPDPKGADSYYSRFWRYFTGKWTIPEAEKPIETILTEGHQSFWDSFRGGSLPPPHFVVFIPVNETQYLAHEIIITPKELTEIIITKSISEVIDASGYLPDYANNFMRAVYKGTPPPQAHQMIGQSNFGFITGFDLYEGNLHTKTPAMESETATTTTEEEKESQTCRAFMEKNARLVGWDLAPLYFMRAIKNVKASYNAADYKKFTDYKQ